MTRLKFFIISSGIIFVAERLLPALTSWPIFIFPIFVILFILTGKNDPNEIPYIAAAIVFFDFFSGYYFGFFAFIMMFLALAVFIFKTRFSIETGLSFKLAICLLFFTLAFLSALSIKSGLGLILAFIPTLILETLTVFFIFTPISYKLKP